MIQEVQGAKSVKNKHKPTYSGKTEKAKLARLSTSGIDKDNNWHVNSGKDCTFRTVEGNAFHNRDKRKEKLCLATA